MTRYFLRLPCSATAERALDSCPAGAVPRLHTCEAGYVGAVEITEPGAAMAALAAAAEELERRAAELRRLAEGWR